MEHRIMPNCLDCGNTETFILTYIEFESVTYKDGKLFDQCAGDRERADYTFPEYKPECSECASTNIGGDF